MKSSLTSKRSLILFSLVLIALGVSARFMPHEWNFTPVTAIALAASAYIGMSYSIGIVLAVMALADISLGFYQWQIMVAVYGSFIVSACIGLILKRYRTAFNVVAASMAASLVFFIVTNAAVWLFSGMYTHTVSGLVQCFIAALPFYRGTFLGDLFFTGFFFGLCEVLYRLLLRPRTHTVPM